jgi:hypothetical protein
MTVKTESPLSITSKGISFDHVFIEASHDVALDLDNPNCLRIFCMDVQNGKFSSEGLHSLLQSNIGRYVFSRARIEQFELDDDLDAVSLKATELLRSASNPKDKGAGGELGEILLYLFLEQKLGAPKLLSKFEIKTSDNQYVFGSDGVHLLHSTDGIQLILGESKIIGNLKSAVNDVFDSILKVEADSSNEVQLVETTVFKEAFSRETAEYIKSLIVPAKRD